MKRRDVIRRGLFEDAPYFLLVFAFVAATLASTRVFGIPRTVTLAIPWSSVGVLTVAYALGAVCLLAVLRVYRNTESLLEPSTWRHILGRVFSPASTVAYVFVFLSIGPLMHSFNAWKMSIPLIEPFSWDVRFMEWDRWLHGGIHPFALLQPILGIPRITAFIDAVYYSWYHVVWLSVIWQAWHGSRRSHVRSQFLLSFALCWILLGAVVATCLSSAGPAFYGDVVGSVDPFIPLMTYLRDVDANYGLHAIGLQELLWSVHVDPERAGLAISAMPSLHVAVATLLVAMGFSVDRWLGWVYSLYALLILIGSIHLGWHYALDGYVAAFLAFVIWEGSGRIVRWWRSRPYLTPAPS